jgi:hypothetical protein
MPKPLFLIGFFLMIAVVRPVRAQGDSELRLTLQRNFGYASGSGEIQGAFTMRASGPEDLQRVVFFIDGDQVGEATQAPFELRFHTDSYSLGQHTLTAVGYTASGQEVPSNIVQVTFATADEGFRAGMRIALPLLGIVLALLVLSFVVSFVSGGKLKDLPPGTPRQYGAAGGAICPRCGRPFSRHAFSMNMLVGKLERCPFCGKWSVLAAQPLSVLRAAEAAELPGQGDEMTSKESEEERMRKELDDSRFMEL